MQVFCLVIVTRYKILDEDSDVFYKVRPVLGCDDLYKHSVISWCEYVDHEPDTTFARGFRSGLKLNHYLSIILVSRGFFLNYVHEKIIFLN